MIDRLVISRFRGIESGIIEGFKKINIFAGPNNSGKTTVLEAIYWATVCDIDCTFIDDSTGDESAINASVPVETDLQGLQPCARIWKRHGKHRPPNHLWETSPGTVLSDGTLIFTIPNKNMLLPLSEFRLIPPPADEIRDKKSFNDDYSKKICVFRINDGTNIDDILEYALPNLYPAQFNLQNEDINRYFIFSWYPDFVYNRNRLSCWAIEGSIPAGKNIIFHDFHCTDSHFTMDFYRTLKQVPDWRKKLKDALGAVFDFDQFEVSLDPCLHDPEKKLKGIIAPEGRADIDVDDFGDGTRHAFKILTEIIVLLEQCEDSNSGIIIWEDPELFLHPNTILKLCREIIKLIKNKPIQLFVSTQSNEVIKVFMEIAKEMDMTEGIREFLLEIESGNLVVGKLDYRNLETWLKFDWDPRHWDQSDEIRDILVEKDSEEY